MLTFVAIIHILVALGLILFVLLQDPKGGAAGVFGGGGSSSGSLFGATGAGNFLTSTTKWLAVIFAISCIVLTYLTSSKSTSVMDTYVPGTPTETAPLLPQPEEGGAAGAGAQDTEAPVETSPAEPEGQTK